MRTGRGRLVTMGASAGLVLALSCGRDAAPNQAAERPAEAPPGPAPASKPSLVQRVEERLHLLRKLVRALPPAGKVPVVATLAPLSPKPVLGRGETAANTTILQAEHADDPFMALEADLQLGGDLHEALRWLASYDPATGRAAAKVADATLERAATSRWLVVVRTIDFVEAEPSAEKGKGLGKCEVEACLFDTTTSDVMAVVVVKGTSAADARDKLGPALAEATGGTFR